MTAHHQPIPKEVFLLMHLLQTAGHQAYLVGGCVRDVLLDRAPKDWDITTNATPEEVQALFPDSVYENQFGTVGVKTGSEDPTLAIVEITTFRNEGRYTDKRHPDEVRFAETVEDDLSRRDFTVNAMALAVTHDEKLTTHNGHESSVISAQSLVDPHHGQKDLKTGIIRTVHDPEARFSEDALRLMRAVRFATELDFQIEPETRRAIHAKAGLLEMIAKERIRDELTKILMADRAAAGVLLLEELGLLSYIMPELRDGLGVGQNKHHIYSVFEHNIRALDYAAKQGYSLVVRMASLLHDVGKPKTKRGEGPDSTFYGHDVVGSRMAVKILDRLRFSKEFTEQVAHLIRYHMFYYNVGEVSPAGVRRFLARVGPEHIDALMQVREADRIGSGVPKAVPYKLRHLLFMIDKVRHDPISPKMLKITGNDVMFLLSTPPGPRIGWLLSILLQEVMSDPNQNVTEHLEKRVVELGKLSDEELAAVARQAEAQTEEFESGVEEEMKKKHYVK